MRDDNKLENRNQTIDSIAGSLVLLVMLGHWQWFSKTGNIMLLFSFYMCWFFWKAGMFYKIGNKDEILQLKGIVVKHVVPFVFWGLLGVFLWLLYLKLNGLDSELLDFLDEIKRTPSRILVLKNPPLWFAYPFLFCKIISVLISRHAKDLYLVLIVLICCAFLFIVHYGGYNFGPIVFQTGTLGLVFFISGYLLREFQYDYRLFLFSIIIFFFLKYFFPSRIMMADNSLLYGDYFVAILSDFSGIIVLNNIFKYITFLDCKVLRYIGKYAMAYYLCHAIVMDGIRFWTNDLLTLGWQLKMVQTVFLIIVIQVVVTLSNTPFLRWTIGVKKKR